MSGFVRDQSLAGMVLEFTGTEMLADESTTFQRVRFFRTERFGVVFMLDDAVMLTERDEFVYHEMICGVPLFSHPDPHRVLVIGGGDLGALRECLRHPGIEEVHVCEIDGRVVDLSLQHLPWASAAASDPRARISVGDGFELLRHTEFAGRYDVILCDVTDAVGLAAQPQSARLFTDTFFGFLKRSLAPGGIVCGQCECAFFEAPFIAKTHRELRREFRDVRNFVATIPTYAGFLWCFYFASDRVDPLRDFRQAAYEDMKKLGGFRYYTDEMHRAGFSIPAFLADAIADRAV